MEPETNLNWGLAIQNYPDIFLIPNFISDTVRKENYTHFLTKVLKINPELFLNPVFLDSILKQISPSLVIATITTNPNLYDDLRTRQEYWKQLYLQIKPQFVPQQGVDWMYQCSLLSNVEYYLQDINGNHGNVVGLSKFTSENGQLTFNDIKDIAFFESKYFCILNSYGQLYAYVDGIDFLVMENVNKIYAASTIAMGDEMNLFIVFILTSNGKLLFYSSINRKVFLTENFIFNKKIIDIKMTINDDRIIIESEDHILYHIHSSYMASFEGYDDLPPDYFETTRHLTRDLNPNDFPDSDFLLRIIPETETKPKIYSVLYLGSEYRCTIFYNINDKQLYFCFGRGENNQNNLVTINVSEINKNFSNLDVEQIDAVESQKYGWLLIIKLKDKFIKVNLDYLFDYENLIDFGNPQTYNKVIPFLGYIWSQEIISPDDNPLKEVYFGAGEDYFLITNEGKLYNDDKFLDSDVSKLMFVSWDLSIFIMVKNLIEYIFIPYEHYLLYLHKKEIVEEQFIDGQIIFKINKLGYQKQEFRTKIKE